MKNHSNLDILRALAVSLVVGDHSLKMIFGINEIAGVNINRIGILGVLFFFVHTCLVLMYSLERQDGGGPVRLSAHFVVRRFFRIYPLSIFVLTVILLFHIPSSHIAGVGVVADYHASVAEVIANLFLVQNVFFDNHILGVLWSLPWEVQMYLTLPLLYLVFGKSRRWLLLLALWPVCVLLSHRIFLMSYVPCFLPGVIAYALGGRVHRRIPGALWPVFIALLVVAYCVMPDKRFDPAVCLALGCGIPFFREVNFRPIALVAHQVATYSYGIYLGHLFCLWLCFSKVGGLSLPVRIAAYPCILLAVTVCMYRFIEKPFISLGTRVADRLTGVSGAGHVRAVLSRERA
jgi:peptidoglycan/LPS O-acetylase OafA/YrhL